MVPTNGVAGALLGGGVSTVVVAIWRGRTTGVRRASAARIGVFLSRRSEISAEMVDRCG